MSIDKENINALVNYRIAQAEETIKDVDLLIANQRWRSAVNRIYYGNFYSLLALGILYGIESSKHAQIIGWFNKNFIHTGFVDPKYGKIINKAFNRRTKGDYDTFIEFDREIVEEMFKEMCDFVAMIKNYIELNR